MEVRLRSSGTTRPVWQDQWGWAAGASARGLPGFAFLTEACFVKSSTFQLKKITPDEIAA